MRDCEKPLHGPSDLSRYQEAERIAVRNGKFMVTVNSIKTSRTRAKTWLILLGKQFRSVTKPRDKRDTESRRSVDNFASLETSSHSVYQAITFTSLLTEHFDHACNRLVSQSTNWYFAKRHVSCRVTKPKRTNLRDSKAPQREGGDETNDEHISLTPYSTYCSHLDETLCLQESSIKSNFPLKAHC